MGTIERAPFRVTAWGAIAAAAVLFLVTGTLKFLKVFHTDPRASLLDVVLCLGPDLLLASATGLLIASLAPFTQRRAVSFAVAFFETLWCVMLCGLSMMEHQSWERSGTLLDWKLLTYTWTHLDDVGAVVGAETTWVSWLVLALVTLTGFIPLLVDFVRGFWPVTPPAYGTLVRVFLPAVIIATGLTYGTPKSARVQSFDRSAPVMLVAGAINQSWQPQRKVIPPEETGVVVKRKLKATPPSQTVTDGTAKKNVIVIVLESTRWDATSVYNPALNTTPNMAKLAERGLVVDHALVDMPHTSKALVTVLCGYPARWVQPIEESQPGGLNRPCLAHIFDYLGYATAFFQSATGKFEDRKRLVENFGYKSFRALENYDATGFEQTNYLGLEDKVMVRPLMSWIDTQRKEKKPFFASMLTTISHHDYGLPTTVPFVRIPAAATNDRYNRYLNTVMYADSFIGDVVKGLEERGLLDDTIIAVVGDHGQAFFEHGRKGHNDIIWQEGIRVPLIISNPKIFAEKKLITGLRRQVDIAPTLMDLAGVTVGKGWHEGQDLLNSEPYERVFTSCWYDDKCMAMHTGPYEIIDHFDERPMEIYDLTKDPKEEHDLLEDEKNPKHGELAKLAADARQAMRARRESINSMFRDVDNDQSWILKREPVPEHPVYVRFDEYVEILGYDAPLEVDPGTFWDVKIYFRCLKPTPPGYKFFGHLETIDERRVKLDHDPAKGRLTLDKCPEGTIVKDQFGAYIPPTYPKGPLTLWYGIYRKKDRFEPERTGLDVDSMQRVALVRPRVTDKHEPELQELLKDAVTTSPPASEVPPVNVEFGDDLELVDMKIEPTEVRRRSTFEVVTTWKVKRAMPGSWRIFVHMDPVRGRRVRQDDEPVRGLLPVGYWQPKTWVKDRFPVYISHKWGWPTGQPVKVWIGLYHDDERLEVTSPGKAKVDDNRVFVGEIHMTE